MRGAGQLEGRQELRGGQSKGEQERERGAAKQDRPMISDAREDAEHSISSHQPETIQRDLEMTRQQHQSQTQAQRHSARRRGTVGRPVHEDQGQRQPGRDAQERRQGEPGNLPMAELPGDRTEQGSRPAQAQSRRAEEKIHKGAREEQVQQDADAEGLRDRQEAEQEIEGIKDRRLRIGDKRRPTELMRVPQRQVTGAQCFCCEQAPGIKLGDTVPHQGVPGDERGGVCGTPRGDVSQKVSRQEGFAVSHDRPQQQARRHKKCQGGPQGEEEAGEPKHYCK